VVFLLGRFLCCRGNDDGERPLPRNVGPFPADPKLELEDNDVPEAAELIDDKSGDVNLATSSSVMISNEE